MIKFMRSAVVVVACLFAGVGAWGEGAKVTVADQPTYASELFGPGHDSPVYPDDMTPVVTLHFPANVEGKEANPGTGTEFVARVNHTGAAEITFELIGAVFDADVAGLMYDANVSENNTVEAVAAPGVVASIVSGGRKGDSELVIKVEEASNATETRPTGDSAAPHEISFTMPRLANLALAGANAADANPLNDKMSVKISATARVISGEFTGHSENGNRLTGGLANGFTEEVVLARDSLTLSISDSHSQSIVIDGDSAFTSIKTPAAAKGYVTLATVTVKTKQLNPKTETMGSERTVVGQVQASAGNDSPNSDVFVYKAAVTAVSASPWVLHDLDGDEIGEGLRGTLTVHASGTRGLFNDGDVLFVDYDNDGKMGEGEAIAIDGMTAEGEALSIDPDQSESFKDGAGNFRVLYMPGGKEHINHDSKIKVMAMVEYSDPSAIDEGAKSNYTTLNFDGVGDPIMAYAIPHSTNGQGDQGNVRVRCEQGMPDADGNSMCRVFLECWDDMGSRGFGEAPMIAEDSLAKWSGGDIEDVVGMDMPMSRHSCRVLSKGDVTVQQLTRDGNSNTLVNNTYVAD